MREDQSGWGRWIFSTALLVATLGGCGDDETTTRVTETPRPQSAAGADPGSTDTEMPRQLAIEIAVAGTDTPIAGTVSEHGGAIRVRSYPERLSLPLLHGSLPLPFDGAFEDDFCESVRELTEADLQDRALDLVRHDGAVTGRLPISSLMWPETVAEANRSASALGVGTGVFFDNPLTVQTLELSLELSEGAMSHALGTEDLSAALDRELERQGASARQTGVLPLSLSAKDLWCDLAHGDATIRVHVIGTFGSQAYEGETLVTGVEPL